jgi:hypothetical protein
LGPGDLGPKKKAKSLEETQKKSAYGKSNYQTIFVKKISIEE